MRSYSQALSVSAVALLLAGCQLTPPPVALSSTDMPAAFTAPVADKNAPVWPSDEWWTQFNAPELPGLIETALKENLDLRVAVQRILTAEASNTVASARLLPTLNGSLGAGKNGNVNTDSDRFTGGLSASYALDFFGQNRARIEASLQNLRSARYSAQTVRNTLVSTVANTYFQILSLRERITTTRANLDLSRQLLNVANAKFAAGVSSNLDVVQQTATVAGQLSQLPALIEQEREARYALAVLLGRAPEGFDVQGQDLNGLTTPTIQPGLPSDLLLRRPDIAQAEANLYASHANVDAARAAFFPSINLTGGVSWSSGLIGTLFDPASLAWNVGSSLAQTIFDGGVLNANSQSAKADQEVQIATYRKTVFTALQQVEAAVGNAEAVSQQLEFVTQQERATAEAQRISSLQYREGTIDITASIQIQQSLFNAQNSLTQTKLARLNASVQLYLQMGGGWTQKASDDSYVRTLDWSPL